MSSERNYPVGVDDDFLPYGYAACDCGKWLLVGQPKCDECLASLAREAEEILVIDVGGRAVRPARPPARKKRKPTKREPTERTMIDRARDRARTRAWIRLARIYEPMFVALYTEEQLREGVEPIDPPPMQADAFDLILRDIEDYRERQGATFAAEEPTIPE